MAAPAQPGSTTAEVYDRAGFGRRVERGSRPAVVVVDFTYGFTDPQYPTGADMSRAVAATAHLLEAARAAGVPVVFTTIAYDAAQIAGLAWLKKATGSGPKRSVTVLSVARNGVPRAGILYAPACK